MSGQDPAAESGRHNPGRQPADPWREKPCLLLRAPGSSGTDLFVRRTLCAAEHGHKTDDELNLIRPGGKLSSSLSAAGARLGRFYPTCSPDTRSCLQDADDILLV
jgi:hypothetical protein